MPNTVYDVQGVRVLGYSPDGEKLRNDRDAVEAIGEALHAGAAVMVIPVEGFEEDFFRLRTRVAGEIVQKFVTYGLRLATVGDISGYVSESTALRDFVYESNRGGHVWFRANMEELQQRQSGHNGPAGIYE